jgi:hypothetical protein
MIVTRILDFFSFLSKLLSFWIFQKERRKTRLFVILISCSFLKNLEIHHISHHFVYHCCSIRDKIQMTNSLCATNWENRTRIDRFERQTNSIVLSSHKLFLSSTIIDSFVDVWVLVANLYFDEQSWVFEFDSSTRNVSLRLIIFDKSFSDFWNKSNWINQLTSVWKCSNSSKHRLFFYIYASDSYNLLAKSRDHVTRSSTNQSNWSHRF